MVFGCMWWMIRFTIGLPTATALLQEFERLDARCYMRDGIVIRVWKASQNYCYMQE